MFQPMQTYLDQLRQRLATDVAWREARQAQIETACVERQQRAAALSATPLV